MMDIFRKDFNYYKQKDSSLQDVLNFNDFSSIKDKVEKIEVCTNCESMFGLKHPKEWEIYKLISNSGFIFIKNPFTPVGQRYWIMRCLKDYPRSPNKTNLDAHSVIGEWSPFNDSNGNNLLLNKLRWATLGYHHNWNTKVYSEDSKSDFPADLQLLSQYVAKVLQFESFIAEAAIVNFYHMNSRLSGHTDHSEQSLDSPLFSFSFGQTAIFLLGDITVDVKPAAMFLSSEDLLF
ncbi:hypothetical protein PPYR_07032 [Photinus pyralis]|uniref:Alpha-ketoglutarate-dependent dioxygenase AlkB-like domain-containing protein n=2 Tax=Photinus pyralis TaxID=7054 RepID=A0A5N4AP73_PHOPY|nr:nucleic acid dioxygenase ALKBH1 [Photinus pyralis]KAB0799152.1 hypothetical protein PPYR_07032 [Photinus pyralis]